MADIVYNIDINFQNDKWVSENDEEFYRKLFSNLIKVVVESDLKQKDSVLHSFSGVCKYNLSVLLCDSETITQLNSQYRNINKATNCLSFPMMHLMNGELLLGDIAMCYDTVLDESRQPEMRGGFLEEQYEEDEEDEELLSETGAKSTADAINAMSIEDSSEGRYFFELHLSHLFVHSVLHLLDYDHVSEDEKNIMESMEKEILSAVNVEIV